MSSGSTRNAIKPKKMTKINTILYNGRNILFFLSASALFAVKTPVAAWAHMNRANAETIDAVMNQAIPRGPSEGIVSICGASFASLSIIGVQPLKWMSGNETTINSIITQTKMSLIMAVYVGPLMPLKKRIKRDKDERNDYDDIDVNKPCTRDLKRILNSAELQADIRDQH